MNHHDHATGCDGVIVAISRRGALAPVNAKLPDRYPGS